MTLPPQAIDTEQEWVERARDGDRAAFEQIYRAYSGKVYGLCLRLTREASIAEDCTQETFISAWRNLGRFEGRSALGTWLHRIAVNAALARGRKGHLEVVPPPQDEAGEEHEPAMLHDATPPLDVEAAIESLPTGARHVLVLYGIYGYTHDEAANMLGIAVGTCKAQLHRARRLLRERLSA
ncbi:MAG TPA: sigma-70 family RNA polymerase sigma factor [Steroidobacteraceae bacterium]|nr:sigma-70 family RNA polymerase sigma factor [Steroidobacteraceae bacterium]